MDLEWTSLLASNAAAAGQSSSSASSTSSSSLKKRSRDDLEGASDGDSDSKAKGKGKQKQQDGYDDECTMDHDHGLTSFEEMGLPISLANASLPPHQHNHRPHHPQNEQHAVHGGASPFNGFGVKGTPGGDCKRICLRHQRMVDAGARLDLQKVRRPRSIA